MNPFQSMNMGMPPKKKATRRGRKPSGKPGAEHIGKLVAAHGKGDTRAVHAAALALANTLTKHHRSIERDEMTSQTDQVQDSGAGIEPVQPSSFPAKPAGPSKGVSMARLAMMKRKK